MAKESSIAVKKEIIPVLPSQNRWFNKRVTFKKNHVKLISSTTDRLRTSLVTIKGKEALVPKRRFISHTHYDELVRPKSKHRQWNDKF